MKRILITICLLSLLINVMAQNNIMSWEEIDKRPIPEWFQDAKFGIFICWGVYSVPAYRKLESKLYGSYAEWYYSSRVMDNKSSGGYDFHRTNYGENFEYRDFAPMFRAELWDPDFWAKTIKDCGAKYVIFTAKFCDGYAMWKTDNIHKTNWNSYTTGPKRDITGELTEAVKEQGLKMGLYYSVPDWESIPRKADGSEYMINKKSVDKYGLNPEVFVDEVFIPDIKELVINYKPSLIFSDAGEWTYDENFWKTREILTWLYTESPVKDEIVTNDRWHKGMPGKHGDYFSSEYKDANDSILNKKYWEESRGMGGSYGYNRAENLEDYRTSEELIHEFIDIVSRGGNLALNIGPSADGCIPVIMQQRLKDIGDWLKVNGEGIYGTRKLQNSKKQIEKSDEGKVYFTQKEKNIYAFITEWTTEPIRLNVPDATKVKNVSLLGTDKEVKWNVKEKELLISLPQLNINEVPCLFAWTLKIETK